MLHYNRICFYEGIYPTKSNSSKECMVCHYLFFDRGFKYQDSVRNGCHDLLMLFVYISEITIITVPKKSVSKIKSLTIMTTYSNRKK